jgi:hypothetical protein
MSSLSLLLEFERAAIALLESAQGELSPEQELKLATIEQSLMEKGDAYAAVRQSLRGFLTRMKKQRDDLDTAIKQSENYIDNFDQRFIDTLLLNGKTELIGESVIMKISPTCGSVKITNKELALANYGRSRTTITPDLDAIRADLEAGKQLTKELAIIEEGYQIRQSVNKGVKK